MEAEELEETWQDYFNNIIRGYFEDNKIISNEVYAAIRGAFF